MRINNMLHIQFIDFPFAHCVTEFLISPLHRAATSRQVAASCTGSRQPRAGPGGRADDGGRRPLAQAAGSPRIRS